MNQRELLLVEKYMDITHHANKISVLCGGGLGDAAICLARIASRYTFDKISITHVVIRNHTVSALREFYQTQNVECTIQCVPSFDWLNDNKHKYDARVSALSNDSYVDDVFDINPLPPIKYEFIPDIDVVVWPLSGYSSNHARFNHADLLAFHSKHSSAHTITYIGKTTHPGDKIFNPSTWKLGDNRINNTTISELVNIIASSNTVVCKDGFALFLAAMLGKRVVVIPRRIEVIYARKHDDWNIQYYSSLRDVDI